MPLRPLLLAFVVSTGFFLASAAGAADSDEAALQHQFTDSVHPFVETYCVSCHGKEKTKGDLDLTKYATMDAVTRDHPRWATVLDKLTAVEMPPEKAKAQPTAAERQTVVAWIQSMRKFEAYRNAGDPGIVLARRLSNAEYDYTVRDLTGADIRPTKEFPVDPANEAGFDNSGESLAMSPALLKKYLEAAHSIADYVVFTPHGLTFAPFPVVADTDRDRYSVNLILGFYEKQDTNYAHYFEAAWQFKNRSALGKSNATLADIAAADNVSPKYLNTIWTTLETSEDVGPIAKLQTMWRKLPRGAKADPAKVKAGCEAMSEFVVTLRQKLVPDVPNLMGGRMNNGSQPLLLWKDRQLAANRTRYDTNKLQIRGMPLPVITNQMAMNQKEKGTNRVAAAMATNQIALSLKGTNAVAVTNQIAINQKGTNQVAMTQKNAKGMAKVKKVLPDPDLTVPKDLKQRARYQAAFAKFCEVFPDAFYISERGRTYADPETEKEKGRTGRLLNAGFHSMTGYFRDDGPLYGMMLDDSQQHEIDQLWDDFFFMSEVAVRMHTSFLWFERSDSSFMMDPGFSFTRPEDKTCTDEAVLKRLANMFETKARTNGGSAVELQAIHDHFETVNRNVRWLEKEQVDAVPAQLASVEDFAERAYRRPLTQAERDSLVDYYHSLRKDEGLDREDAIRDMITSVLMSPKFCYRVDLIEAGPGVHQLADNELANRLSYFLWASMPDKELLDLAAANKLHQPAVLIAQARRMLQDPRARNFVTEFAGNWLDFRRFEQHNGVDRERFPSFNNDLREAMFQEPIRFTLDVMQQNRSILDFVYAKDTFANPSLAKHYGMPAVSGDENHWVHIENADAYGRGGLLPMSVFLTANSPGLRTSPVKRGYWVVRRVLGERIPPPPADVPELPHDEAKLGDLTLRQVLERHRADKTCAACHAKFDSFGLVFEGYGAVGERREKDFGNRPVDTRAVFPDGSEDTGFDGLIRYVKSHRQADFVDNLSRKLLAYALGRTLILSDDPLVEQMHAKLAANGYKFDTMIDMIVTSPQFLNKRGSEKITEQAANSTSTAANP
jgi:mono/diheme cytochrome c family protein